MRMLLSTLLAFVVFISCTKPKAAEYRGIESFEVKTLELDSAVVDLGVKMFNPNQFDIKVWSMKANCTVANDMVGSAQLDSLITLPSHQETLIPLHAKIAVTNLLSNGLSLLLGGNLNYTVNGTAKAGKGNIKWNIPFSHSGKIDRATLQKLFR